MSIDLQANEPVNIVVSVLTNIAGAALCSGTWLFHCGGGATIYAKTLGRPGIARALGPSIVRLLRGGLLPLLLPSALGFSYS
jgi:hypothetical protein